MVTCRSTPHIIAKLRGLFSLVIRICYHLLHRWGGDTGEGDSCVIVLYRVLFGFYVLVVDPGNSRMPGYGA